MLAEAIAGRTLVGSWMGSPESHRIYNLLGKLYKRPDVLAVTLILGKEALAHASLGPAIERIAGDPRRRETARRQLTPLAGRLLHTVDSMGQVRMDRWNAATLAGRKARLLLERELLVFSKGLHTEHGYHTAIVMPWSQSKIATRYGTEARRLKFDDAVDELIVAALRSAVVAPEREVRRWFPFGDEGLERLVRQGTVVRLGAGRHPWLAFRA